MDRITRPQLFDFHGVSMMHLFTDNWEKIQKFQARPDDIVLVSYPKAGQYTKKNRMFFALTSGSGNRCVHGGNTWLLYMLDLLHFGETELQKTVPIHDRLFLLEITFTSMKPEYGSSPPTFRGTEQLDNVLTSPRIIKTHLPVQFLPKSFWEQNCKIVYVARNAKDNVVSYFHFERMTMLHPEPGDWSSYLQRFMEGKMVCGSWYDHVNGWWEKKQSYPELLYMFYEDLVEDTGWEIDRLCCFLGLSPSAEEKERIRGKVQFDAMKTNNMVNHSLFAGMDFTKSSFMRKGKVGDWKNHFTVAQSEEFDEDYKQKMKNPTLQFRTEF